MDDLEVFSKKLSNVAFEITLYSQLYGTNESVTKLNNFNPLVFGVFQKNMYVSICLELAKLLDKAGEKSNKNLSIDRLVIHMNLSDDNEIKKLIYTAIALYKSSIKKFRNEVIAHNDYGMAMKRKILPSNGNIDDLEELCNLIYGVYSAIRFKTGKDSVQVSRRVSTVLPRELDGYSFLRKLEENV
ncbi:hypothetical protein PE36_08126 [Moritella sp. PE36]|uniref:AbiU2 domain-containing protein n=1 Tax=Moritella sp. PE36 TaxID=58051 RepID=UPI0001568DC5|nr:hypothetical protein [Moritella sp. PE36]EDM65953.1 hypothetical protein PE36_08126 [Moritella sp. PE36]